MIDNFTEARKFLITHARKMRQDDLISFARSYGIYNTLQENLDDLRNLVSEQEEKIHCWEETFIRMANEWKDKIE